MRGQCRSRVDEFSARIFMREEPLRRGDNLLTEIFMRKEKTMRVVESLSTSREIK